MYAKAKVIAEVVDALGTGLLIPQWTGDVENPFPAGTQLVTLTDHEAALAELAELAERHAATERNACLMAELANEEKNKRVALLTGLEALAGELKEDSEDKDLSDVWRSACVYYAHRVGLLTTLTNSAKGGA